MDNNKILKILIKLSKKANKKKEVPISALIVYDGKIISKAYNKRNKSNKTIDHAEIIAIIKANKKLHSWRLNKCSLYVTVKPCIMCEKVIKESRISNVYYYLDSLEYKTQYNKTNFKKIDSKYFENSNINEYKKILKTFWKKQR